MKNHDLSSMWEIAPDWFREDDLDMDFQMFENEDLVAVYCMHCGEVFMFQAEIATPGLLTMEMHGHLADHFKGGIT